jgi:hypothetical protein
MEAFNYKINFQHINGHIVLHISEEGKLGGASINVTEEVMPAVDDYLDYHLDLGGKPGWVKRKESDTDV